ncbi:PilZ domain-containing protein [Pseudoduganella plicata]|uniref:PilZ domain-containing protein n=1 Tax=Pseudoduganella plicata TaxID=321984 RepID=A0AA88CBZ8_9BURK|nr:PilZ domain-containing protein [Pseudoduganella plicata]GGY87582.1 hypothetical protein GCM10007388_21170 [Pseudoduganella plicata]
MSEEQRQNARKILRARAMLVLDGAEPMPARTVDISLGGVSVTAEYKANAGQTGQVMFEMLVDGKPTVLNCRVKVAHCIFSGNGFRVGCMFQGVLSPQANAAITRYMK